MRGIVRTRALSLLLYVVALLIGVLTIPLVLIGPTLLGELLPDRWDFLVRAYWPVVSIVTAASLTSLFHVATPQRSPWLRDAPGAALTLVIWFIASFVLRGTIAGSLGGESTSIYGPLAAPIVILIWLYFLAIAVLIGAALNAAIRTLWPSPETRGLRERAAATVRRRMVRRAADDLDAPADDDPLSLHGIKEAARRPLTPVGGGRTLEDDLADVHESSGPPS